MVNLEGFGRIWLCHHVWRIVPAIVPKYWRDPQGIWIAPSVRWLGCGQEIGKREDSSQQENEFLYLSPWPGWTWGPLRLTSRGYRKLHPRNREADTWSPLAQCSSEVWVFFESCCLTTLPVTDIIRRWCVRRINTKCWWSEDGKNRSTWRNTVALPLCLPRFPPSTGLGSISNLRHENSRRLRENREHLARVHGVVLK